VVSTPLKNISQIGNLPQLGVKIKNISNHHPDLIYLFFLLRLQTYLDNLSPEKCTFDTQKTPGVVFRKKTWDSSGKLPSGKLT